ncbi:MAG: hypothetical protein ACP6IY_06450 [Promethearchaeia archaeon]
MPLSNFINKFFFIDGKNRGKQDLYVGEKLIKENKIDVHQVNEDLMDLKIGLGETEIIHNSSRIGCPCMIEDKKAKRIAESFNLDVRRDLISILEAYQNKLIDNDEFEDYLMKWIRYVSPSYEEIYFVKKIKELMG